MFWDPPPNRQGHGRRLQDDVSWTAPAIVVGVERKEGVIKRVWLRYRNKLTVPVAVVEEMQAADIAREALQLVEKELTDGQRAPCEKGPQFPAWALSSEGEPNEPGAPSGHQQPSRP
ncbi:unnamed protein product [Effrenium voratum]|uniref:Uncharacterized protein n=1 Tax=Effrenium voratum TaxID=2562239 RepID=A0AA36I2V5_9DINO|nr:unnamed protein product [Effrenium voratum]